MPNPSQGGIAGDPWHRCEICDGDYRLSQLDWTWTVNRNGAPVRVLACPSDQDNPRPMLRDSIIREKLENAEPDAQKHPKLRFEPDDAPPGR